MPAVQSDSPPESRSMPRREGFELAERFRTELTAHCYRMLGSMHDAEDMVQETYLRAWRSFGGFEGRSSLRTWLYRIATSVCLRALENRGRRVLPSGVGGPATDPDAPLSDLNDALRWVEPVPDTWLSSTDPEQAYVARQSVRLALVAAMQQLPARQRAVLLLRDVVMLPADEVAELLDTTTAAVNSALQRARAQLAKAAPTEDSVTEPAPGDGRDLVDRYADAFERADVAALARLVSSDVRLEMPPLPTWFAGREAVVGFLADRAFASSVGGAMVATSANGQAAFAAYHRYKDGTLSAHGIHVLTPRHGRIAEIVVFLGPGLFDRFGLPATIMPGDPLP
jgi:RNA polymerase sigma-70 factor, ECF subfamily